MLGALGFAGFTEDIANSLLFAAWSMALSRCSCWRCACRCAAAARVWSMWVATMLVPALRSAVVIVANVALFRHDVHFDLSREGRNTPPQQFTTVVDHLQRPLSLTYFYNAGRRNALTPRS